MGEVMARSLGVSEGDGEDGVHGRREGIDGSFPVTFKSHEWDVELFNPSLRPRGTREKNHPFAELLGEEFCRGKKFFGIFGALSADNYELVFFHRIKVMLPLRSVSAPVRQRMRQV